MINIFNLGLAYFAGALTILSPCVLPLVPIVFGSAAQKHKAAPFALAAGLVLSFTLVGFAVALLASNQNFDPEIVRQIGAALMILIGILLLSTRLQAALTTAASPIANWAQSKEASLAKFGLLGQGVVGALLGLVWSPCIGPTLGAATVLAAEGRSLPQVALTMFAFALGIASVLLLVAFASRSLMSRIRGQLLTGGAKGKRLMGWLLILVAIAILTGIDHIIEGLLVSISPDWLNDLTTSV